MATTTVTITSATNPTYGGYIGTDGAIYNRKVLSDEDAKVTSDGGPNIQRAFAFFDLSTDPTSGGDITKVELLATVASVSGTHAVDVWGGENDGVGMSDPPTSDTDENIYTNIVAFDVAKASSVATSAGAITIDLGVSGISETGAAISNTSWLDLAVTLSNEAVAGSVVFDAAVGFGLRITYTAVATGGPPPFVDPYGMGAVSPYQNEDE